MRRSSRLAIGAIELISTPVQLWLVGGLYAAFAPGVQATSTAADTARFVKELDHPNVRMMYDTFG